MPAISARPTRGVKRLAVALVAAVLLTLTACYPEQGLPDAPSVLRPPTSVTAEAGDGEATVSWVAPSFAENVRLDYYTITCSDGQTLEVRGALRATVTGLTNGTAYTFTVTATNSAGTSIPSEPSNEVIPAAP